MNREHCLGLCNQKHCWGINWKHCFGANKKHYFGTNLKHCWGTNGKYQFWFVDIFWGFQYSSFMTEAIFNNSWGSCALRTFSCPPHCPQHILCLVLLQTSWKKICTYFWMFSCPHCPHHILLEITYPAWNKIRTYFWMFPCPHCPQHILLDAASNFMNKDMHIFSDVFILYYRFGFEGGGTSEIHQIRTIKGWDYLIALLNLYRLGFSFVCVPLQS